MLDEVRNHPANHTEKQPLPIHMQNDRNPGKVLCLATSAWWEILSTALDYGWNPLGAVPVDVGMFAIIPPEVSMDSYFPTDHREQADRMVVLEDALNLADALERAFKDYEPLWMPASYFRFEPEDPFLRDRPAVGTLLAVADFCNLGAFAVRPSTLPVLAGSPVR